MGLLRDLVVTANDTVRLVSDVARFKLEEKKKIAKRGAMRLGVCMAVGLVALGFVGAGIGLLVYGSFVMVANQLGPGPSGLIIGAASSIFAGLLMLLVCGSVRS
jgi:hypothetical protein